MLKHFLKSRETGNKWPCSSLFSLLLEQYESSIYDEYGIEGEEEGSSVPPLACEFSKDNSSSHILGLVDENGYVVIYNTNKCGPYAVVKDWRAHNNAIFDLAWMEGESKLLTAAGDQSVVLWDVPTATKLNSFQGHTSSVRSVNFKRNDPAVFATGSRDGHVMIWDTRCSKKGKGLFSSPVQVIKNAHSIPQILKAKKKSKLGPSRDSQQSVTIVVYQTDTTLLSAGAVDGCVKMWDLRKNYSMSTVDPVSKHTFNYSGTNKRSHGYSSLVLDSYCTKLFASCTDDIIYQYDLMSLNPKPEACFKGHQNKSFYVKAAISPDNQFLLSGSSNDSAYIWKIDNPNESPVVLKGHNAEVTDVSWNRNDFTKLATLSDDNTLRVWRLNRRLTPREPREITGFSERTHREIGTCVRTQIDETPSKIPCPSKAASPSILEFIGKIGQKSSHPTEELSGTPDNEQSAMNSTSRVSCKRKLVCDDMEDKPAKRQCVGDQGFIFASPQKQSTSKPVTRSPWKFDENPNKWLHPSIIKSPIGSPRKRRVSGENTLSGGKRCVILKEIPTSDNSPPKSKPSVPMTNSVPSHVKTKLFTQSPTVNLPNLVLEGTVRDRNVNVHNKENSPKQIKQVDWLTQKRMEKESKKPLDFSSPKTPKSKSLLSDRSTPKREFSSPGISKRFKGKDDSFQTDSSQESTGSSQELDSTPRKIKQTPPKGMKSLKHYFSTK